MMMMRRVRCCVCAPAEWRSSSYWKMRKGCWTGEWVRQHPTNQFHRRLAQRKTFFHLNRFCSPLFCHPWSDFWAENLIIRFCMWRFETEGMPLSGCEAMIAEWKDFLIRRSIPNLIIAMKDGSEHESLHNDDELPFYWNELLGLVE